MTEPEAEFLALFRDEADERLDRIVATLLAFESGEAGRDALEELFREVHTIKGAAAMLGLHDVRVLAHAFEDVLESVREAGEMPAELVDPLLRSADALRRRVAGGREADATELLDELAARRAQLVDADRRGTADGARALESDARPAAGERRSIRVPAEKIDRLLDLVGETVLELLRSWR